MVVPGIETLKLRIFVFPPPRAPVTPPPPRATGPGQVNRTSPPAALRNCGAERVFAPPAGVNRSKHSPFCPPRVGEVL